MPLMTIFEPLFLILVLVAVIVLMRAAVAAVRGRRGDARRALTRLGIAAVIYMVVVFAVSLATPRRNYRIGDTRCFDDWCVAVTSATRPAPTSVTVGLRLSSRARRVPQRELGTVVYLIDSAGHRYDPVLDSRVVPLDTLLQPGQSVDAWRTFAVPRDARGLGLVYTHQGGFPIGSFIIGENEWAHGPPVVQLDSGQRVEKRAADGDNKHHSPVLLSQRHRLRMTQRRTFAQLFLPLR